MPNQYEQIVSLIYEAKNSNDEIELDLFKDLIESFYKYVYYRLYWNIWTPEQKDANNRFRSSAHNRAMDTLNILLRYKSNHGKAVPDLSGFNRKEIGDMICQMVADFSNSQR